MYLGHWSVRGDRRRTYSWAPVFKVNNEFSPMKGGRLPTKIQGIIKSSHTLLSPALPGVVRY